MNKNLIMLILTSLTFLAVLQPVSAWGAPNHYAIVEEVYNTLPADAQKNLDLDKMLDGADDPDYKFMDYEYHHYPDSQEKINYWLGKGREYYLNEDYNQASYCFGVATHYISDSVCPPHSGGGHSGYQHTKLELQAIFLTPHLTEKTGDVDGELAVYSQMSGNSWEDWLQTGDNENIQQCLNKAADLSYLAVNNAVL